MSVLSGEAQFKANEVTLFQPLFKINQAVERLLIVTTSSELRLGNGAIGGPSIAPPLTALNKHPEKAGIKYLLPELPDDAYVTIMEFQKTPLINPFVDPFGGAKEPFILKGSLCNPRDATVWIWSLNPNTNKLLAPTSNLANLSTRAMIGTEERSLIAGLVVSGNTEKTYAFRALGAGLKTFGLTQTAGKISVVIQGPNGFSKNYTSTRPEDTPGLAAWALTTPTTNDIAGFVTLSPGAYTFRLTANTEADTGIGIVEIYRTQ